MGDRTQRLVGPSVVISFSPSTLSPVQLLTQRLLPKTLAAAHPGRGMLIAIDASIGHGNALAASALSGAKVLRLDPAQDSIQQITQAVHRYATKSIHIITHGSPGCLHFSSGTLALQNLHHYAEPIESWFHYRPFYKGSSMKVQQANSFLSLYACSLAAGATGQAFLENLHYLVGVSIHATRGNFDSVSTGNPWRLDVSYPFPHEAMHPFSDEPLVRHENRL